MKLIQKLLYINLFKLNQKLDFDTLEENDDFLKNYEDLGSDSEDEENFINIKSNDIQNLF